VRIPILWNHDWQTPVGWFEDGVVTFTAPITKSLVEDILGNIGFEILEGDILSVRVQEWSVTVDHLNSRMKACDYDDLEYYDALLSAGKLYENTNKLGAQTGGIDSAGSSHLRLIKMRIVKWLNLWTTNL
jgi:hypothetical protein